MATLARLKAETERLKNEGSRRVYVSSSPVQAFRVAHEKKELLTREHPLILAVDESSNTRLSLVDASVGPDLRWSLSAVNHVLRTASKWGEPTYIFANILDNDPQAFVAVTLRKGTPADELEHLESVLGRVSQLHVAEKKPAQLPDAGDVMNALGKGLMAVLGISSGSKQRERERERDRELQQRRQEAAERAAYLSGSRAGGSSGGGVRVAVHGHPLPDDDLHDTPTAPGMLAPLNYHNPDSLRPEAGAGWGAHGGGHAQPMGVGSKAAADARLAALKAELAKEGPPPSAPDIHAGPQDSTSKGIYTPQPTTGPSTYQQQQQQQDWQRNAPGTLSNPFSTSSHDQRDAGYGYAPYAAGSAGGGAAGGQHYPSINYDTATTARQPEYGGAAGGSGRYNYADAPGGDFKGATPTSGGAGYYDWDHEGVSSSGPGGVKPWGESGAVAAETDKQLREEAQQARLEWERTQREEQQRAEQAQRAQRDDGGWGAGRDLGRQQQQQQQKRAQKPPPDWLDVLGRVLGGGPAYTYGYAANAPDL